MSHSVKDWIEAFRLRTLPLALSSVLLGNWLAAAEGAFRWSVFLLTALTTLLLQILSNLANDYGDAVHGADLVKERKGPARAVQSGKISRSAMKRAILVCSLLALLSGLALLFISLGTQNPIFWIFLLTGLVAIAAAITYTVGAHPYGYAGLGDLAVLIFFGWVGVIGAYYLQTLHFTPTLFLPATACGLLAVAVLNINNIRDIESDKKAGKRSLPVRIGVENAVLYHWLLLLGAIVCCIAYALLLNKGFYPLLFMGATPSLVRNGLAVSRLKNSPVLDFYLKQMAFSALFFTTLLGVGTYLAKVM
ncbi:MAG: 1,4-dihydroxy-2-naphthoate polyprenyltransferase [Cytophagales bacterium]|nr:1,4-dihydroxy-2-naphthoate polyprenyltransferase [Bernardetiaceae bacterium]MDW8210593.1 1,4-dihydroxy-2-naphthoate polyprenyltransferase [Cytophagales bacterium]